MRRLTAFLLRGGFVLALLLPILITSTLSRGSIGAARVVQFEFYLVSLLGAVIMAGYVANESGGDRYSGFMSLVALTGLTAKEWCMVRVVQMWSSFLGVWIVRLPVACWVYTHGHWRVHEMVWMELLALCLFAWLSAYSLHVGSQKLAKGLAFGAAIGAVVLWEVTCNALSFMVMVLSNFQFNPPTLVSEISEFVVRFSIVRKLMSLLSGGLDVAMLPFVCVALLLFAAWSWLRFTHTIYADIGANTLGLEGENANSITSRKHSVPRCWDSALAWQAFFYHQKGYQTFYWRIVGYALMIVAAVVMNAFGLKVSEFGAFFFMGGGLVFGVVMIPNVALAAELKEKTLPSLTLAVGDPVRLFLGWLSAGWRMAAPDLLLLPLLLTAVAWAHPSIGYIALTAILGIACTSPLFFCSSFITGWSWANVRAVLVVIVVALLLVGVSVLIGLFLHWALIPLFGLPVLFVLNHRILYRSLPNYFDPLLEPRETM